MAINLREAVAAKMWSTVPSMCDETWEEAKLDKSLIHQECVSAYYRFADAALTTIEPTLRRALEALEHWAFKDAKDIRLLWTSPPARLPESEFGSVIGMISGPWNSHMETPDMTKAVKNARSAVTELKQLLGGDDGKGEA